ncbi:cytochrome c biogenesis protein CcsA [Microbacterium album]|uniref:Heme exporter protein C n=1 Tax=Microbacterium album TaxID=2053191 RepID=A0A917IHS7_9MICO|nr:cytochrome c biogenesis protein CcsA [Microbacterium album]GGH47994.1 cytochrome c biogenesis protein [Microbacterium album]
MEMKTLSAARRDLSARRAVRTLLGSGGVALIAALALGLLIAPADRVQGEWQRLMYVHVPAAWSAYLCFAIVLGASALYLWRRGAGAARVGRAAAEAGVALTALTLASGSAWGAATWGTWWVWDGRTTSTVAMALVYVVYLAARAIEVGRVSRLVAAGIGVVGFAVVPVVHLSVLWWRTLHQPATLLAPSTSPPIHPLMGAAILAAVLAVTIITLLLVRWRAQALASPPVEKPAERNPVLGASGPAGRIVTRRDARP